MLKYIVYSKERCFFNLTETTVNFFIRNNSQYLKKLKEIMNEKKLNLAFVKTYGCQQNFSDSEKIRGILKEIGFEFTDSAEKADLIIFNTCAIREHAEDRVFGNVGALKNIKKKKPNLLIALCGCMMEQPHVQEKIKKSFPFVDLTFGTDSIDRIPELLYNVFDGKSRVFDRANFKTTVAEGVPTLRDGSVKASVPVMYGCDNFCSYCIVPYVRGREKSREPEDIISEVKKLIDLGYKEIMLLGQNVNSYGKNLTNRMNFSELLKEIDKIDGEYWVRFMTSHPKDVSYELIDTISDCKHVTKQLHLPFQSGNDRILKEMNRHYTREKYLDVVSYAKNKIPEISLTSDVIVGFPGETELEFEDTLNLVKIVGFTSLFTFIYSKRVGTPANEMPDPNSKAVKQDRFNRLLNLQAEISDELYNSMVGRTERVLIESKALEEGKLTARTGGGITVELIGDENLIGKFIDVKIKHAKRCLLLGEKV